MTQRFINIQNCLDANKAENIENINLDGTNYIANLVILATAYAEKHLQALLNHLKKDLY